MTQAAGKLNHRIRLESLETSQDDNGETVETWTHQGDVWAEVAPMSAREFISAAAMQSKVVARITIRYHQHLQANWRIRFRNRYYNIEGVLPDTVSGLEYLTLPVSYAIIPDDPSAQSAWESALPGVVSFVSDNFGGPNPHNQTVMPSPPVITRNGATLPAGMTVNATITVANQATSAIRILGGTLFSAGGNLRVYSAVIGTNGGNGGLNDGKECSGWRADFDADAAIVTVRVPPTTAGYRFIVNGRYVSLTPTQTIATSGAVLEYFKLDFTTVGGKALRRISIEGDRTCGLAQVWVGTGDTVVRPADTPKRIAFAGDSFTSGSLAPQLADGFAWVAADTLGFGHSLNSGSGGTGYVVHPGTTFKLFDRLTDINSRSPHDIIVVAMGINDIGQDPAAISAQVTACLNNLRTNNPAAQLFVVGPWNQDAPEVSADYLSCRNAITAGIPNGIGVWFLNPQAIVYEKADALHPNVSGHSTLGNWLAEQIKIAIGA